MSAPSPAKQTEIHIARGGVTFGAPRSLEETKRQVSERYLRPNDLAWCEGLNDWVTVETAIAFAEGQLPMQLPSSSPKKTARIRRPNVRLKVRPTGRIFRMFSLLNRNVKKERVTSEEFGEGLWKFCKSVSRELHTFLKQLLGDSGVGMNEEMEFNATQEIVILNLWLLTRELSDEKKALVALHQKYFVRQGKVAGELKTREEQVQYMKDVKRLLMERCEMYYKMWNSRLIGDQTVLCSYFLEFALSRVETHPKASDKTIIHQINAYLRAMPKTIKELRGRFEIKE